MTMEDVTTIKVPKSLRERVSRAAAEADVTAAGLIASLLDQRDHQARFAAVRRAYASPAESYAAETAAWDAVAGDGL